MSLKIPKSLYVSELGEEFWRKPLYAEKLKQPHGTVNLIKDRCKGCEFCTEFCPQGILELSDDFNAKGYHPPKVIEKEIDIWSFPDQSCRMRPGLLSLASLQAISDSG